MQIPSKFLENAVYEISKLPGIGSRTAIRLALHLLRGPKEKSKALALAINQMIESVKNCEKCHSISDENLCKICSSPNRDSHLICVVEDIRDVMAIENTSQYKGLYHVLGGKISPMEGIGPSHLSIERFLERISENSTYLEIIFALSSTIEADTTILYICKQMQNFRGKVSTLARGLSVGEELEYVDEITLGRSIINRVPYANYPYERS